MSADKTFLGRRMMDFSSSPAFRAFSRVTLWVDDNNCYTAGDDTGRTLEADCPWATQSICDDVLSKVNGYQYVPFTAMDAMLDPAAEIGDGVTANGRYSVISSIEATFDPMFTATVQAPADEELDHEFPYKSSSTRSFERKLAQTRAAITVKADEIMEKVEDELKGLSSSINVKLDSIKLEVTTESGTSSISLLGGGTIDLTGFVTFTGLAGGTTTIDGGCIKTGTIDADRINLTGAIAWGDLSSSVQNKINNAGDTVPSYIKSTYIDFSSVSSPKIVGNEIITTGHFAVTGDVGGVASDLGYMGGANGLDAAGNTTYGVALSNGSPDGLGSGDNYLIVTNGGVRMQAGTHSLTVTSNGCYADGSLIGSGAATWG